MQLVASLVFVAYIQSVKMRVIKDEDLSIYDPDSAWLMMGQVVHGSFRQERRQRRVIYEEARQQINELFQSLVIL